MQELGFESWPSGQAMLGKLRDSVTVTKRTWARAFKLSLGSYMAKVRKPSNGRLGYRKVSAAAFKTILNEYANESSRFWKQKGTAGDYSVSAYVAEKTLRWSKRRIFSSHKFGCSAATAYRVCKKECNEFTKGSNRVDVCPIEHRFDFVFQPRAKA
jgi:hypothetical protein